MSKPAMVRELARLLISERAHGRRVVAIIDEAQNLSLAALEELRMLSNLETEKSKLIQIVLVVQPDLRTSLDLPSLVSQRPQVDALAPRRRIPREKLCAVFRGSDANLIPQVVAISIQQRREHLAEYTITIRPILRHPRPHRGEAVGEAGVVAPALLELLGQRRSPARTRPE